MLLSSRAHCLTHLSSGRWQPGMTLLSSQSSAQQTGAQCDAAGDLAARLQVVGQGKCSVVDTYWQTETGGHVVAPLPGVWAAKPGSATLPFFGVQPAMVNEQVRQSWRLLSACALPQWWAPSCQYISPWTAGEMPTLWQWPREWGH